MTNDRAIYKNNKTSKFVIANREIAADGRPYYRFRSYKNGAAFGRSFAYEVTEFEPNYTRLEH